jgi:hypothetical protein
LERYDEISLNGEALELACGMTMRYVLLITDLRVILLDNRKLSFNSAPILRDDILKFEIVEKKKSNFRTLVLNSKDSKIIATFESLEAADYARAILEGFPLDLNDSDVNESHKELGQETNFIQSKTLIRPRSLDISNESEMLPETWIAKNGLKLSDIEVFDDQDFIISENSWFNVETSEIFISNYFPENCDTCNIDGTAKAVCSACKRNPTTMLNCMSANSDGDYLIFELENEDSDEAPMGTFISFAMQDDSIVVPVVIGTITIDDGGYLFFGDRFSTCDSQDFVSGIQVDGNQTVIAWVGASPLDGQITPLAVTTSNADLTKLLLAKSAHASDPPIQVKSCVQESLNGLNAARMGRNAQAIADLNAEIVMQNYGEDDHSAQAWAQSWTYQVWADENYIEFVSELLGKNNDRELVEIIYIADLLRIRGSADNSRKVLNLIIERRRKDLTPGHMAFIDKSMEASAGVFLPPHFYALL